MGRTLRFGLLVLNPQFGNFTEGFDPRAAKSFYKNGTMPTALDAPVEVVLVGRMCTHSLKDAARPVIVTLKNASGAALRTEEVTAEADRPEVSFDLSRLPPGVLAVEEQYPDDITFTSAYYADPELQQQGAIGVIEISIDSSFYTTAPAFEVAFDARQETLKYYLVARNYTNGEFTQLQVEDAGFAEEGRAEIAFTKVDAAAFTPAEIPAEILGGAGAKVVLFKSQALVARQQQGRKKIQLVRNNDVLIEHLPQPGADRTKADLIIHLSKP